MGCMAYAENKKPMVYARSESKSHGKENKLEGVVEAGKRYIVVEDLISTGGSSINTINTVRENGLWNTALQSSLMNLKNHRKIFQMLT